MGQVFNNVSETVNIPYSAVDSVRMMAGIIAFDYDNDLDDDLLLTSAESRNPVLYTNNGNFEFEFTNLDLGIDASQYSFSAGSAADFDNDGYQDLLLCTIEGQSIVILRNKGDGTFEDKTFESGLEPYKKWGTALAIGDFNRDSFLDFYVGNNAEFRVPQILGAPAAANEFFLSQDAAFKYEEVSEEKEVGGRGYTLAVRFIDFDNDNDLDIYVANDFGSSNNEPNKYYENIDGSLVEKGSQYGLDKAMLAMGIGYGDFDNDRDFDFYLSDIGPNTFYENNGNVFTDIEESTFAGGELTSWGGQFLDANNDGLLDIVVANGGVLAGDHILPQEPFQYYENLGGQFLSYNFQLVESPFYKRTFAVSDFDNDGDLDIVVNPLIEKDTVPRRNLAFLENASELQFSNNNYLQLKLESKLKNRDAIGSTVRIKLSNGEVLSRYHDIGGAYMSSHTKIIHFGIGTSQIDSVIVKWPGGNISKYGKTPSNSLVKITEGEDFEILRTVLSTSNNHEDDSIIVYPTRVTKRNIHIKSSQEIRRIQICNLNGQKVMENLYSSPLFKLDLEISKLQLGTYLLRVFTINDNYNQKIIIRND